MDILRCARTHSLTSPVLPYTNCMWTLYSWSVALIDHCTAKFNNFRVYRWVGVGTTPQAISAPLGLIRPSQAACNVNIHPRLFPGNFATCCKFGLDLFQWYSCSVRERQYMQCIWCICPDQECMRHPKGRWTCTPDLTYLQRSWFYYCLGSKINTGALSSSVDHHPKFVIMKRWCDRDFELMM